MDNARLLAILAIGLTSSGCLRSIIPEHDHPAASPMAPAAGPAATDDAGEVATPTDDGGAPADGGGAVAFNLQIEAESAAVTAPMAAQSDANVSGGQYLMVPAGGVGGKAVFNFSVPRDGKYAIWGKVLAPADLSNSFHLSIDTDTIDNDPADAVSTIWDLTVNPAWAWSHVNMRISVASADLDQVYQLTAGAHTLYLNQREAGTGLDRLLITDDLVTIPTN